MYFLTLLTFSLTITIKTTTGSFSSSMAKVAQKATKYASNVGNKVSKFNDKVNDFNKVLSSDEGKLEGITGAIESVGGGAVKLVEGIINGNWQDMIVGALGVIGGLASLAGPVGAIISSILSVVSMLFGLFGGEQKAEESQESMLKRVINEALTNARAEELKADGEGLKKVMLSIRNSINQFRESGVTEAQANELFTQVFTGLDFFGKLKYEINKYCDCSITDVVITTEKRDEKIKNSEKCLQFLNLYSDLSIYRLLLITDMASLFSSVELKKTGNNVLLLSEKERLSDKEILMFLFDPINNHRQRFCISQYFAAPNKYPTIMAYTDVLKTIPNEKKPSEDVTVCSGLELLGVCYNFEIKSDKGFSSRSEFNGWDDGIQSIYVADKLEVIGYGAAGYQGDVYGPFYGPTVIGMVPRDPWGVWHSMKIRKVEKTAQKMVRVCKKENFKQDGLCQQFGIGIYGKLDLSGTQSYSRQIKSLMIPEGVQVEIFSSNNYHGDKYGPFYGPNSIDDFCQKDSTVSMKISSHDKEVSKMVKICKGLSFSLQCEYLEVKDYPDTKINGCTYYGTDGKIKSMAVPAGRKVEMWTDQNYKGKALGPYVGPLTLSAVEGTGSSFEIKSLKVKNVE